jgi:hypothetical protein
MPVDATVVLESLHCNREKDESGHSEPYLWPALLSIGSSGDVNVIAPVVANSRVVIKSDMRAGQTAAIPISVGILSARLDDGARGLILATVLLEADDGPAHAWSAGFQAFTSGLRDAVAEHLLELSSATGSERDAIIAEIKASVANGVMSAIRNNLTTFEKIEVRFGLLDLDDNIDNDFLNFPVPLVPTPIHLVFAPVQGGISPNNYEIQGSLQVRPVLVDPCQTQVDRVKTAQAVVDGINNEITSLQAELQDAGPLEKPGILVMINMHKAELVTAQTALNNANQALQDCRSGSKATLDRSRV